MDERQYKLRYLPLFSSDLSEIIAYIQGALQNPDAAYSLLDAVEAAILERTTCAEAFEPYRSNKPRKHPYYRIYVGNYTIYYTVEGDTMEVRRILYNKRNTDALL